MGVRHISIRESVTGKDTITIKRRTYYSISHIQAAAQFAKLSANIERAYNGRWSDELFHEHRAYVTGCVFAAVSFLEATINELFADAVDNPEALKRLNPEVRALIADMWRLGVPRPAAFSILEKFKIALTLARKQMFAVGPPYEDVVHLVRLRNALVHYEPEWITTISQSDVEAVAVGKFQEKLGGKFPLNPLAGEGDPFFPNKCLGYGCAKWAVTTSLKFADEFFSRMGLTPTYDHVRPRLKTE